VISIIISIIIIVLVFVITITITLALSSTPPPLPLPPAVSRWCDSITYNTKAMWIATTSGTLRLGHSESGADLRRSERDGTRDKFSRRQITFDPPLPSAPAVWLGASLLDASNDANLRLETRAENITPRGFELVMRAWHDINIYNTRVAWVASTDRKVAIGTVGAGSWPNDPINKDTDFTSSRLPDGLAGNATTKTGLQFLDLDRSRNYRLVTWVHSEVPHLRVKVHTWWESVIWNVKVSWIGLRS
jgi:hypothetical protein